MEVRIYIYTFESLSLVNDCKNVGQLVGGEYYENIQNDPTHSKFIYISSIRR